MRELMGSNDGGNGQNCTANPKSRPTRPLQAPNQFGHTPRQQNKKSNMRQVHVAIGESLLSNLNDANHRHEYPNEPEPADCEIRFPFPRPQAAPVTTAITT